MLSIKTAFRSYFPAKTPMNQIQDKLPSKTPMNQAQDKSTQTDFKSQRPKPQATSPPPLQRLPLELLYQIADNLPASSRLALIYTSNWFYGMYDPKTNVRLSNLVRDSEEDRLEYLCFVERDAESPKHSYTCSVCVERHPADRFSAAELLQDPEIRTCQRVWICEHGTMGLANYRDLLDAPVDSSGVVMYPPSRNLTEEVNLYWNQCCPMARRWFFCTGNDNKKRLMSTTWSIPLTNLMALGDALARGHSTVRLSHPLHVHGGGLQEDLRDFPSILLHFFSADIGALQTIQQRFHSEATITVCDRFTFPVLGMEAFEKFSRTSRCGV